LNRGMNCRGNDSGGEYRNGAARKGEKAVFHVVKEI